MRVLRDEFRRVIDEIRRSDAGAAVDVLLDGVAVDEQRERLPHRRIAEQRMLGLRARALALDIRPWIGVVDLDVLDIAAREDLRPAASAPARFEPHEDFVL